jgi:acyl-CoA thioesterase
MSDPQELMPEQDSLYATMGLHRIVEMTAEGTARLEYEAGPHMCHSGGVVQGGFVTGWIDAAMAHAAIARAGDGVTPMTLEIKVSFLAPVRPGLVIAEAWAVRHGRKTCFYEGALKDAAGNLLAKASSTMLLADRGKVEAASKLARDQG